MFVDIDQVDYRFVDVNFIVFPTVFRIILHAEMSLFLIYDIVSVR